MKKVLVVLCSVVALSSAFCIPAYAIGTFKPHFDIVVGLAGGQNVPRAEYGDGLPDVDDDQFFGGTRAHLGLDYTYDENLSAVVTIKYGGSHWGEKIGVVNTRLDNLDSFVRVRRAHVNWMIPTTDVQVRLGLQAMFFPTFSLPASPSFVAIVPGVLVHTPLNDNIKATAMWARPAAPVENVRDSSADLFGGFLDFRYENLRFAPHAYYLSAGVNAAEIYGLANIKDSVLYPGNGDLTQVGVGAAYNLDDLTLAFDVAYSMNNFDQVGKEDGSGWFALASVAYNTKFGVPKLMGWYASGDDDKDQFLAGNYTAASSSFRPTTVLFKDRDLCPVEGYRGDISGTAAILAEWKQLSFVNKLSHTVRAMYLTGTNDEGNIQRIRNQGPTHAKAIANTARRMDYLTSGDNVIEVNFDSTYQMYKNFRISFDLGYMNADLQDRLPGDRNLRETYRATMHFFYAL